MDAPGWGNANHGLVICVARGKHGGETGNLFLAAADGARLFKLPAATHDFERAFAVDFFLQTTQRTFNRFTFFQFNLGQCTHFLSGAGDNCQWQFPRCFGARSMDFSR